MSAADELLDHVADVLDHDARDEGFVIDNLAKATWAVAKIRQHRRKLAEAEATAADWRARIDEFLADARARCANDTGHLEDLLRIYHQRCVDDDNPGWTTWDDVKHSKTVRTPAGDLVAKKTTDTVDVDAAVFVPWAIDHAPDLLNPPVDRTPAKVAIRKAVGHVMADGQVVDAVTGVFLPGVTWVEGDVTYTVKTREADQ